MLGNISKALECEAQAPRPHIRQCIQFRGLRGQAPRFQTSATFAASILHSEHLPHFPWNVFTQGRIRVKLFNQAVLRSTTQYSQASS